MEEAIAAEAALLTLFFLGGILLILLGFLIWRRLWDSGSVEVDAQCIDAPLKKGAPSDRIRIPGARRPVYHYCYAGKYYAASPLLAANRPGYDPVFGCCKVRINRKHPEKMYSPERKTVALILITVGLIWIGIAVLVAVILPAGNV